jgi:uncharacterized membrane protein
MPADRREPAKSGPPQKTPPPRRPRSAGVWRTRWWLLGITVVGAALRLLSLNTRSFWLDEATSVRQASWPAKVILARMSENVHPPLFHLMLHYWIVVFGRSEVAVRMFDATFGIALIPVAFWAARTIYKSDRIALISASVVAVAPFYIWYAQEARMYSPMLFFAMVSTGALWGAMENGGFKRWALYALSTAAGMMTQYFFVFLLFGQALFVLIFALIIRERVLGVEGRRQFRWRRPWLVFDDCPDVGPWLMSMVIVAIPQMWWIPQVLAHRFIYQEATNGLTYGASPPKLGWHFNDIILAASRAAFGMHSELATRDLSAMWPLIITVTFIASGYFHRVSPRTWYLILTGVVGASTMAIIGQWQPIYEVRYFTAIMAPLALLLARFLAELGPPVFRVVAVGLVLLALVAYVDQSFNPDSSVKWDNRQAAAVVYKGYEPGDIILLVPYYAASIMEYYLPPPMYFAIRLIPQFGYDGQPRSDYPTMSGDLDRQVGAVHRVWLVSSFLETPQVAEDQAKLLRWLKEQGYVRVEHYQFHRIEVALYEGAPERQFFAKGVKLPAVAKTTVTTATAGEARVTTATPGAARTATATPGAARVATATPGAAATAGVKP